MKTFRVGVLLEPQYTTFRSYAEAVRQVEALGVDTIWNWDHFIPLMATTRGIILKPGRCWRRWRR